MVENEEFVNPGASVEKQKNKVGQEQIQGLLFGEKLSWQAIIYDLINTEQLDPWDIDLSLLANKYLVKVRELEEHNFFISAKVLFAAALLLRMKSEILLDYDLPSLDAILMGRKDEAKKYSQGRIELNEDIPELVPRTPLPRFRKVSLQELMAALGKAISTETRRIKRVVVDRQREMETAIAIPKHFVNLHEKINDVYAKLKEIFAKRQEKLAFSELAGSKDVKERIYTFVPLLHLDNQHKVWLEQNGHFEEIWILLKDIYEKQNSAELEKMKREVEEEMKKLDAELSEEERQRVDEMERNFENPIGEENF